MRHLLLLGDSTLDNSAYVPAGEAVISRLRSYLPKDAQASLLAQEGATIAGVGAQLAAAPADVTHLILSVGGNDALGHLSVLAEPAASVADALATLTSIRDNFAAEYQAMLEAVVGAGLPTAICTVYDALLPDLRERSLASTALTLLNDVITRAAVLHRLPLLDLRVMFSDDSYYANATEPSGAGSAKIAAAITELVAKHDFNGPTAVYA